MKHTCIENAIPLEVTEYIKQYFFDHPEYHIHKENNPNVIKINAPWTHFKDVLDPILSQYFHTNNGQGGNLYKHSNLYSLHTDSDEPVQLMNCCIPIHLEVTEPQQKFVVFDQHLRPGLTKTWYGEHRQKSKYNFDFNGITYKRPYDDEDVQGLTKREIDPNFYFKNLRDSNHQIDLFYGLTGTAYDFKPGNLILLDSQNIHCTGTLIGPWKMGLLIQFEGTVESLLK